MSEDERVFVFQVIHSPAHFLITVLIKNAYKVSKFDKQEATEKRGGKCIKKKRFKKSDHHHHQNESK